MVHEYRDRIFIRKDILLKLYEYDKLNQSKLMSYCGLNNALFALISRLKTRIIGIIAGNIIAAIPAVHIATNKDSAAGLW
jgi:hypothetical protein